MLRQITFSEYRGFQSNALEFSMCQSLDKDVEQNDGRKSGGWEAEFQERIRKELACLQRGRCGGVFVVSDPSARPSRYFKVSSPTRKIQYSSKLRQVRKWKAEIQDTPLGLNGIGKVNELFDELWAKIVQRIFFSTPIYVQCDNASNAITCIVLWPRILVYLVWLWYSTSSENADPSRQKQVQGCEIWRLCTVFFR